MSQAVGQNVHSAMDQAIDYLLQSAEESKIDLEILATQKKSTGIAFQQRKMEQFTFSETHQLGLRVVEGRHEGLAYTESLDRSSLDQALIDARANAQMIEREWIAELAGPRSLPELKGMFNPALEEVPVQDKINAAAALESAALDFDSAITSIAYTRYTDVAATMWIANSKGLRGSYRQNYCMGYTYCLAKDGDAAVMAGEYGLEQSFERLNTKEIARLAAQQTLERRGATRPKTGTYSVVFENRAAENLIGLITGYFSSKSVDDNTSPLKGKQGQAVFSAKLTLNDDPLLANAFGSRPFDDEGYPSLRTTLIESGVVKNFLTNSVMARKLGLPHTASAARSPSSDLSVSSSNVLVSPGSKSLEQLLNSDQQVILITELQGTAGFRATSGDFSIPMEGFLYENGKRTKPLKDFLVSGNILSMLATVLEVGNDVLPPLTSVICPSLLIPNVNVSGQA